MRVRFEPHNRLKWAVRWLPALLWMGLIFWVSSRADPYRDAAVLLGLPVPSQPGGEFRLLSVMSNDALGQLAHAVVFFILGLLLARSVSPASQRAWWAVFALGAAYVLTDEIHQAFVPGRAFQWVDILTDWLACGAGLLAVYGFSRRRASRQGNSSSTGAKAA